MRRASTILKETRLDREIELVDISKKLKVPLRYLEAFESETKSVFPQEPYCSLIVKDYATFLGLNGDDIVSIFRRDFEQKKNQKSPRSKFRFITPRLTFTVSIIALVVVFSGYLIFEYIKFNRPPKLKVNWPSDLTSSTSVFELRGETDSESVVRINQDLIIVNPDGSFYKKLNLNSNQTVIQVESKSPNGKTSVEQKTITLN